MDDIIVFSRMAEDHLDHLEKVFTALQQAELKIKASKCQLFKSHVCYLGFLIGESGIRCVKSKVEAINKITTPTSIKESDISMVCVPIIRNLYHILVTSLNVLMT